MEITPEIAFSAAQILSMLLVATMFDPWSKGVARGRGVPRVWVFSALVSYAAKVLALIVLLFDMQLVLFQNSWTGGQGLALGLGNYIAVACSALTILLAVLSHIGALGPAESAAASGATASGAAAENAEADADAAESAVVEAAASDRKRVHRSD